MTTRYKHTPSNAPEDALCCICSQLNTLSSAGEEEVPVPYPFVCGPLRTRGLEVTTMRRQITESMPSPQNLQDTDHELQMRLRNSELMPSICQKG